MDLLGHQDYGANDHQVVIRLTGATGSSGSSGLWWLMDHQDQVVEAGNIRDLDQVQMVLTDHLIIRCKMG
jgi:hypothetical protein